MAYQKKTWQARQGTGLNKFKDTISGNTMVLVNTPDSVSVPGDAFSVENMNDLEDRIERGINEAVHYWCYGVRINANNSNPATKVEYTDDAVGFTPAAGNNGNFTAGSWGDKYPFTAIKRCLMKAGRVVGYLNEKNLAQFENGTAADITSGDAGDVMTEYPFMYYRMYKEGNYLYCKITNEPGKPGFTDNAFNYKGVIKNHFWAGTFKGWVDSSGKLRSLSGKTPTVEKTITQFRTHAQANGAGYEQTGFYQLLLRQILYVILYKSTDSQSALGRGFVDNGDPDITGRTVTSGTNYGTNSGSDHVCCLGLEDFWGNVWEWVDGFIQNNYKWYTAFGDYNDNANGYAEVGSIPSNLSGYIKDVQGTNDLGFVVSDKNGSSTTYYCDYASCYAAAAVRVAAFGGSWSSGDYAGAFRFSCLDAVSYSYDSVGARLAFCG